MGILRRWLRAAAGLAAAAGCSAAPILGVCRSGDAITIDGRLDEDAWQQAIETRAFRVLRSDQAPPRASSVRCLYSNEALLLGVRNEIPPGGLHAIPKTIAQDADGPVYGDECVEIYLAPSSEAYYHFVVNIDAVRYDGKGTDASWNADWTAATAVSADEWTLEVRIPFAAFADSPPPSAGSNWGFNIACNDRINAQYATWAQLHRGFHEPAQFGRLHFLDTAFGLRASPLVRLDDGVLWEVTALGAPRQPPLSARLALRSPGGEEVLDEILAPTAESRAAVHVPGAWRRRTSVWTSLEVHLGDTPVLSEAPVITGAAAIRAARSAQATPVRIGNAEVELIFDQGSGRLLSAVNRSANLHLDLGARGLPTATLETVNFLRNPRLFRDEDTQILVPDYDTLEAVERQTGDFGERLRLTYELADSLGVTLSITVPPQGTETQWDIDIDNRLSHRPSRSRVIHRVRYPCFDGIPEAACGDAPHVVAPYMMGQRFPEPATNLARVRPLPYIGPLAMGWFDFYGNDGGLYVKVGDVDPLPETHIILQGDPESRTLTLAVQRWALCWPGERWTPGPCGVAPHAGDWHAAADLYREWFRKTFRQLPRPEWLVEADGYVMSGSPSYEFSQLPRILENAQAIGIDYIQLWSEMTGGELSYHAFGFPNPYMGTERDLKDAIREVHRRGGHLGVYLNYNTGDPLLGTFLRQPRLEQKIPPHIPRPALDYMQDNWVQQSLMNHAGSYSMWSTSVPGYLDDYWNTCPAADKWRDFYYYWAIDKWAREYKLDVWYLDSCPVSRGSPCFATDHGHTRPAPEGQSIIDFFARLRRGAPRGFGIMQEYASDRLLQYGTHALGLMWHARFAHPEVVRYTLPEFPLFSGMCNGTAGMKQFYPGERLGPRDAIERVFLIGNRFEFPLSWHPPETADDWRRRIVALRRACHPEMSRGDFLDDVGLGATPEQVYARWFRHPERTRLVVSLLDRRDPASAPPAWELSADLARVGATRVTRAWMRTLAGEERQLRFQQQPGQPAIIPVDPIEDRVAAVFLEVE